MIESILILCSLLLDWAIRAETAFDAIALTGVAIALVASFAFNIVSLGVECLYSGAVKSLFSK